MNKKFLLLIILLSWITVAASATVLQEKPLIEQFALTSPSFPDNGDIPELFTCKGSDVNPPLLIHNVPEGTRSMVLAVREPENPIGPWTHWLVYNIRPGMREIKQGSVPGTQALNDFGNFYYGGPCVFDAKPHHFLFTVYALNSYLDDVNEGATMDILEKAIAGRILGKAQLVGVYQNPLWGQDDDPL